VYCPNSHYPNTIDALDVSRVGVGQFLVTLAAIGRQEIAPPDDRIFAVTRQDQDAGAFFGGESTAFLALAGIELDPRERVP
jgi:hypothetical protein